MLRKIVARMNSAALPAYITLKITLILSCILMAASIAGILFGWDRHLVRELFTLPQSVLLIGGLLSVIIEDISS